MDPPWVAFWRHYIRDLVYAAHDGLVTTFAVVAGVRGAQLDPFVVLALGAANLAADGLSMAVGNYLGIKSEQAAALGAGYREWDETVHAARHGSVTWLAFVAAGLIPLLPFLLGLPLSPGFGLSCGVTAFALFAVGAARTFITGRPFVRGGLEMLFVGALAGAAAFLAGGVVGEVVRGTG